MADSKISALSAITSLAAADQLAVAHSGASNSIRADHMPGFELDYVQITSGVNITATTDATANSVIDGNAVSFDGSTRIKIEFWTLSATAAASGELVVVLYDGSTDLGRLAELQSAGSSAHDTALYGVRFLTPSNASHTFHIKAWTTTGTSIINAGAGGAGVNFPAWYRITVA